MLGKFEKVYFFEEGIKRGGIGELLGSMLNEKKIKTDYKIFFIFNTFVKSAKVADSLKKYHLDSESMVKIIKGEI